MMQKVIVVASQKGGSGKSTLATALAVQFDLLGFRTWLIDADPQGTSAWWWKARRGRSSPDTLKFTFRPDGKLHRGLTAEDQLVFIDCPGRIDAALRSALLLADVLLVPMHATYADAWALSGLAEQLQAANDVRAGNEALQAWVVLNRIRRGTRLAKNADQLADSLPAGFEILKSRVRDLSDFQLALGEGKAPVELRQRGEAANDVAALTEELAGRLASAGLTRIELEGSHD